MAKVRAAELEAPVYGALREQFTMTFDFTYPWATVKPATIAQLSLPSDSSDEAVRAAIVGMLQATYGNKFSGTAERGTLLYTDPQSYHLALATQPIFRGTARAGTIEWELVYMQEGARYSTVLSGTFTWSGRMSADPDWYAVAGVPDGSGGYTAQATRIVATTLPFARFLA